MLSTRVENLNAFLVFQLSSKNIAIFAVLLLLFQLSVIWNTHVALAIPNVPANNNTLTQPPTVNITGANGFLTYQNSTFGFKMIYPAGWKAVEFDAEPNDTVTDVVTFFSPFESRADNFTEYLIVASEKISGPSSLSAEKYADGVMNHYQTYYQTDVRLIDKNTTTAVISGKTYPTFTLLFSEDVYDDENNRVITLEKGFLVDGRVYIFQYPRNYQGEFQVYLPVIKQMIDSFELIGSDGDD